MNNLHISLTDFRNESRVMKQASSLLSNKVVDRVFIASLHSEDLPESFFYNDNLILTRFKLKSRNLNKNILFQSFKYLEFSFKVLLFYKKNKIKLINIHSVSLLPLGVLLKFFYKAKLIYDTHELETETNGLFGVRKKLAKFLEKFFIKFVDNIFVVSENIADWYRDTYKIDRPTVLLNAPKYFAPTKKNNKFREHFGIAEDVKIFLYQGALAKGRGVELLLKAFSERNDAKSALVLMGYGELEARIKQVSENSANIYLHPAVSPQVVLDYTSSADYGFSFIENTCLSYFFCMPNKLFEYIMAGLPVLISNVKEMSDLVKKYEIGLVIEEEKTATINFAIEKIQQLDIGLLKQNLKKCAIENSWEMQEDKMIKEYKRFLNER